MADQVELALPKTVFDERSAFTATVRFRDRATASASTPTTAEYRLYNITNQTLVKDWTSLTPAGEVSIAIDASNNVILGDGITEAMQFLVVADRGLSTQTTETAHYMIKNLGGGVDG